MEKFMIMCETTFVSRGTIRNRKTEIFQTFERLSDAEFVMEKLYKMYNKEMSHQLDDRIKSLRFRDKCLGVTIDDGFFEEPIKSKLYYIYKRL